MKANELLKGLNELFGVKVTEEEFSKTQDVQVILQVCLSKLKEMSPQDVEQFLETVTEANEDFCLQLYQDVLGQICFVKFMYVPHLDISG
jgi:hypothetical protein